MSRRPVVRAVALPSEHGGWSLTLEPVLLGLVVAPSGAGVLLGVAALVSFLLRTPVRLLLVDAYRRRRLPRTRVAALVAGVEAAVLVAAIGGAVVLAASPFWWPLAAAAPLVVVAFAFDAVSRSRRLLPEVTGSVGIAAVAAAVVLADGGADDLAAGLWIVAAARAIAAVGHVRVQVRRTKGQAPGIVENDLAQLVAVAAVGFGLVGDLVTAVGAAAVGILAVVHLALVRVRPVPVAVLGAQQVVLGLAVVLTAGLAAAAP
ncbi:MAG: YwiC-like family protein [Acidimicrobiia bacterium]|nr:YwiC-like family protein [Acidimicrobiia bacterium]